MAECIHPILGTVFVAEVQTASSSFLESHTQSSNSGWDPRFPSTVTEMEMMMCWMPPHMGILDQYLMPDLVGTGSFTDEQDLIQQRLPYELLMQTVLGVLRLNITVPLSEKGSQRWPVTVFVHGGNFAGGSPAWSQNDLARFVKRSQTLEMPLIGVGISYRTAAPLWLRNHIEGFGGGPDNITLVGQSAGAVSGILHLASNVPLFKRLACLGGQFLAVRPLPAEAHDDMYTMAVHRLGLGDLSPSECVRRFESLSRQELLDISFLPSRPIIDGKVCTAALSFICLQNGEISREWSRG
ncbi:Alpha/Beta hydrolase protein [Aspergillus insuetus]